jgi:hypothetical protein
LTATTSFAPGPVWMAITNSVQNTGGTFYVTLPVSNSPAGLYRLQGN